MIKKGLGTGLGALFNGYDESEFNYNRQENVTTSGVEELDVKLIITNPNQPRKVFNEDLLQELAQSIKNYGVIQPITVVKKDDKYIIVAGERRFRASLLAGLKKIPAIIKEFDEKERKEIALIENLQREDLNAIEEAVAMRSLIDEYGLSQEQLAERLGKSRPAVTNALRLLNLTSEVRQLVIDGRLSAGHARCLIPIKDFEVQKRYALAAADKGMSVRELELMVNAYLNPDKQIKKQPIKLTTELKALQSDMSRVFATKIKIAGNEEKGRIYIDYFTKDDLNRIYEIINFYKEEKNI